MPFSMRAPPSIESLVRSALGTRTVQTRRIPGGDINSAFRVDLDDGRAFFVKTHDAPPRDFYAREADGLAWLAEPNAIRVPRVIASTDEALVLEWIERGDPSRRFDDELGRGLATLHRSGAPAFGWHRENYVGTVPQRNEPAEDWASFYATRRLGTVFASVASLFDARVRSRFETLLARLPELVGPSEPPARLHGDCWSGNVMTDERGQPVLVDPAVYGGHREIDLAMLELFGHVSTRTRAAYEEVYPLAAGWRARVPLYQLYPLLVHVKLFGRGYVSAASSAIDASLRA